MPRPKNRGLSIRRGLLGLVATCALLVGAAWSAQELCLTNRLVQSDPEAIPEDVELIRSGAARGRVVFRNYCASCHGRDAKGDAALGVPDLTDADWLYGEGRVKDIEKIVAYGIRAPNPRSWNLAAMPAYGQAVPSTTEKVPPLSPQEIGAVSDYLLALGGSTADPANADWGARIYNGRGGCYDCHANDAKGDRAIGAPNLVDSIWIYGDGSRAAIAYSITHGRQGFCPAWSATLSQLQLREVSLFVYVISHGVNEAR